MQIVGTIVNKNMNLIGLLIKGKPLEFGYAVGKDYMMNPFKIEEVKALIKANKIKDYQINEKGNIEGIGKKLSNLPMYDSKGNFLDKRMEIRSAIEDNGNLVGAVIYFPLVGKEKKLKLDDLSLLYEYFEPTNFGLRNRDGNYYLTGKGDTKKEDIPVINKTVTTPKLADTKSNTSQIKKPKYIPLELTHENIHMVGYTGVANEKLVIPQKFSYDGEYYEVKSIAPETFAYCKDLTSIVIPEGVTKIGSHAFLNCSSLSSIVIPNSVVEIGFEAFEFCENLTSIVIPAGIKKINDFTFVHCDSLISLVLPKNICEIGVLVFCGSGLRSIVIPDSVTTINDCAFAYCEELTSIEIPNSITKISNFAFMNCSKLTSIVIPNSVTSIGYGAFYGCSNLKTIYYRGSKLDWSKISKCSNWDESMNSLTNLHIDIYPDDDYNVDYESDFDIVYDYTK